MVTTYIGNPPATAARLRCHAAPLPFRFELVPLSSRSWMLAASAPRFSTRQTMTRMAKDAAIRPIVPVVLFSRGRACAALDRCPLERPRAQDRESRNQRDFVSWIDLLFPVHIGGTDGWISGTLLPQLAGSVITGQWLILATSTEYLPI